MQIQLKLFYCHFKALAEKLRLPQRWYGLRTFLEMGFYHRRQHSTYRMQRERDRPVLHQHRAEWNIFLGDGVTPTALLVADLDVRIQCRKIRIRIESIFMDKGSNHSDGPVKLRLQDFWPANQSTQTSVTLFYAGIFRYRTGPRTNSLFCDWKKPNSLYQFCFNFV